MRIFPINFHRCLLQTPSIQAHSSFTKLTQLLQSSLPQPAEISAAWLPWGKKLNHWIQFLVLQTYIFYLIGHFWFYFEVNFSLPLLSSSRKMAICIRTMAGPPDSFPVLNFLPFSFWFYLTVSVPVLWNVLLLMWHLKIFPGFPATKRTKTELLSGLYESLRLSLMTVHLSRYNFHSILCAFYVYFMLLFKLLYIMHGLHFSCTLNILEYFTQL